MSVIGINLLKEKFQFKEEIDVIGYLDFESFDSKNIHGKPLQQQNNLEKPHMIFLIDTSMSMSMKTSSGISKIESIKHSIIKLIKYNFLDNYYLSIVTYDRNSSVILEYVDVEKNSETIISKIESINNLGDQTNVYKGFKEIEKKIIGYNQRYSNRVLVFTDGEDFEENLALNLLETLVSNSFIVSTVGIGDYNEQFLLDISNKGKGSFYHLNSLEEFFNEIVYEIQNISNESFISGQLKIHYPSNTQPYEMYRIGNSGIVPLDLMQSEINCGNISSDDKIFFRLRLKNISKEGRYSILNGMLKSFVNGKEQSDEFSIKIIVSENQDTKINSSVIEINRQVMLYQKAQKLAQLQANGEDDLAKELIYEIEGLASAIGFDDITSSLSDFKLGKFTLNEFTKTILSLSRTKTITKTRGTRT